MPATRWFTCCWRNDMARLTRERPEQVFDDLEEGAEAPLDPAMEDPFNPDTDPLSDFSVQTLGEIYLIDN